MVVCGVGPDRQQEVDPSADCGFRERLVNSGLDLKASRIAQYAPLRRLRGAAARLVSKASRPQRCCGVEPVARRIADRLLRD